MNLRESGGMENQTEKANGRTKLEPCTRESSEEVPAGSAVVYADRLD